MKKEPEDVYVLMAPCGAAIEVWEPLPQLTSWCFDCEEYHVYIPE